MSIHLLDNVRMLQRLVSEPSHVRISFDILARELSKMLTAEVYVLSTKGKVLGMCHTPNGMRVEQYLPESKGSFVEPELNARFLMTLSTRDNAYLPSYGFSDELVRIRAMVVPIEAYGVRYGTLFIYRERNIYDVEEIVLCEYCATIIGMESLRVEKLESAALIDKERIIMDALSIMSDSELRACSHIFAELGNHSGMFVATDMADRFGIARTTIVMALKKLQCSGVLEAKSAGKYGTMVNLLMDISILPYIECVMEQKQKPVS